MRTRSSSRVNASPDDPQVQQLVGRPGPVQDPVAGRLGRLQDGERVCFRFRHDRPGMRLAGHRLRRQLAELSTQGDRHAAGVVHDHAVARLLQHRRDRVREHLAAVQVQPALVAPRLVALVLQDHPAVVGVAVADVVPQVHLRQQFGDRLVQPGPLDVQVHQARVTAVQVEDLGQRRDAALVAEPAGVAEPEPLQVLPGPVGHVAVGLQVLVEHVVVEADEHAVLGGPDVDLVAVPAQLERGPERLQGVLVGELGRAPVANDVGAPAPLGDALVSLLRLVRRLDWIGRAQRGGEDQESDEMSHVRRLPRG